MDPSAIHHHRCHFSLVLYFLPGRHKSIVIFCLIFSDHSLFGEEFYQVSDQSITLQLIAGALLFGLGWGLSGI
jgi:uncharacterized membrane protein YedE/YeeE